MKHCKIYHTGVYSSLDAVLYDKFVLIPQYIPDDDAVPQKEINGIPLYSPNNAAWWAEHECDGGLVQFELEGKWGFCKNDTGEIIIEPAWDFAAPFYHGSAMVALDCTISYGENHLINSSGGKYGFIDKAGNTMIPLQYDMASSINNGRHFLVRLNGKWGLIDCSNQALIPFEYDGIYPDDEFNGYIAYTKMDTTPYKYTLFDRNGDMIADRLTVRPSLYKYPVNVRNPPKSHCYLIQRGRKFGIVLRGGPLIAGPSFLKHDVLERIHSIDEEITGETGAPGYNQEKDRSKLEVLE